LSNALLRVTRENGHFIKQNQKYVKTLFSANIGTKQIKSETTYAEQTYLTPARQAGQYLPVWLGLKLSWPR